MTREIVDLTIRLRLVRESDEDDPPSLSGIAVYDATGEDITHITRAAGLRKCPAAALPERRRKGGVR